MNIKVFFRTHVSLKAVAVVLFHLCIVCKIGEYFLMAFFLGLVKHLYIDVFIFLIAMHWLYRSIYATDRKERKIRHKVYSRYKGFFIGITAINLYLGITAKYLTQMEFRAAVCNMAAGILIFILYFVILAHLKEREVIT